MVRFVPPRLGRLLTIALQARVQQDGPVQGPGGVAHVGRALPPGLAVLSRAAAAVGGRASEPAAATMSVEQESKQQHYLHELCRFASGPEDNEGCDDAFLCFLFGEIRDSRPGALFDAVNAARLAGAKWGVMAEAQRAPYINMARTGQTAPLATKGAVGEDPSDEVVEDNSVAGSAGGKLLDEDADFAAFIRFLYDEVRAASVGASRTRAFTMASDKWRRMDDAAKMRYLEQPAGPVERRPSRWRRFFRAARDFCRRPKLGAPAAPDTRDGDAFLCFFYDEIRAMRGAPLDHVTASKLAHAHWRVMTDRQKAPYLKMAERGQTEPFIAEAVRVRGDKALDTDILAQDAVHIDRNIHEDSDFAAFMNFVYDEVRDASLGSSRVRAFTMASAKWIRMDSAARARYAEALAKQKADMR